MTKFYQILKKYSCQLPGEPPWTWIKKCWFFRNPFGRTGAREDAPSQAPAKIRWFWGLCHNRCGVRRLHPSTPQSYAWARCFWDFVSECVQICVNIRRPKRRGSIYVEWQCLLQGLYSQLHGQAHRPTYHIFEDPSLRRFSWKVIVLASKSFSFQ